MIRGGNSQVLVDNPRRSAAVMRMICIAQNDQFATIRWVVVAAIDVELVLDFPVAYLKSTESELQ